MVGFRRLVGVLALSLWCSASYAELHKPYIPLDSKVLDAASMPFTPNSGKGKFDNWVGLNVPIAPIEALKKELEKRYGLVLKSRGEAHITLLTPLEYWLLEPQLKIDEINQIVATHLQKATFTPVCVGTGEAPVKGKMARTFFVVVVSPDLLKWREKLQARFVEKGGDKDAFPMYEFFPHITVGYTDDDLHLQQGVVKDARSCALSLKME